ncbi:MAG: tetratricopeptide repeat protein [Proteobacteria bacterium]|nr:tetratricopeptide repeat protein [Pseudomonadota bacterium]
MRMSLGVWAVLALLGMTLMTGEAVAFDLFTKQDGEVAEGNEHLAQGKPEQAMASYNKVPGSLQGNHSVNLNRGLALSRMGEEKIDEAMQVLQKAADSEAPDRIRARALANLGNAFFKKEDYEEAIKRYQQSLMLAPGNKDIAWNLELAMQRKKQQEQDQQEQDKQDQQDQDKQEQDKQDQQDQDKQEQDQQEQDQQEQDKQDQQDQDKQEQDQQEQDQQEQDKQDQDKQEQDKQDQQEQEQQPEPKTKQEVEQLLDALDKTQENLQKQMAEKRRAAVPSGGVKDW